jgi:extracellular factor (EF) 3-hydroxypalmitic acid methyl ester biosynthesis protein
MHNERFFDQTLDMIEQGNWPMALPMLAGKLHNAFADAETWPDVRTTLHGHRLHQVLMEDPFSAYSARRPRGYPGDAGLIDIIYDQVPAFEASELGRSMFEMTVRFQAPEGVRQRRIHAETVVSKAWRRGQRILVLASGHFREGDRLIGQDVSNIVLVDQDPLSLDVVRRNHGSYAEVHEANVFRYLKAAAARGERFDLVYTLGLTDYLDVRAMRLLHKMVRACLAPGGSFLLANFLPNHLGIGWMDAVMDWQLIYRDEAELTGYAGEVGLAARTWRDPTGSVVWCEMVDSG